MKRLIALLVALMMVLALTACGGGDKAAEPAEGEEAAEPAAEGEEAAEPAAEGDVSITIFNSKSEIHAQMEAMAAEYEELTGVHVEVYMSQDLPNAHLVTKYAAGDPYTISMVDPKDVYSLGPEHAIDLSDEAWVENTSSAISVDGKVLGFPVCVEARGVMYNADAIEAITGEEFDPATCATRDGFVELLDKLVAGGMEAPVGIMKEEWSLANHYITQAIESQEDPAAFLDGLKDGSITLADDPIFNDYMDTFDVLMKYNYASGTPVAAEREVSEQKLAEGEIAFMFGGNWDWSQINVFDYTENMGMMPVPLAEANDKLVGGSSKCFFIDSSENTSDAQRQAAKDFLNWLVSDPAGNEFLTVDCALLPPFTNIAADNLDPLSASIKTFNDAGMLTPNYDYFPDDLASMVGQQLMQRYLAGQLDRAGLAQGIQDYFAKN